MQLTEILLSNTPESVFVDVSQDLEPKTYVVVQTPSGPELGVVKGKANNRDDIVDFLRVATKEDMAKNCENCRYTRTLLPEIKKIADEQNLNMKIGFISTNLDKSKIVVNYTADERVDFRELIKILASKYKSRIEMRQIGNRDESKQIGALGMCGRVTCCKLYLADFDKVSIKMAKDQNIALNPNRINGMCGRLLCCLKYENEYYEEMQKKMPRNGARVTTPDGEGKVVSTDFLKETVTVEFTKEETTERKTYALDDITKKK